jgi:hypothetical protein
VYEADTLMVASGSLGIKVDRARGKIPRNQDADGQLTNRGGSRWLSLACRDDPPPAIRERVPHVLVEHGGDVRHVIGKSIGRRRRPTPAGQAPRPHALAAAASPQRRLRTGDLAAP